ncbi:fibronectin type III domain-containing protein 11 [Xenopus laevis]|uniref:Fibronectin type III domain-containing protein 11 n=2 Tax=Xenopus laevis TaxID=8355 RepID=A0A1L8ET79_XENLA|nr:fibronectin type III domain-containing protein 11 [Xenopus laevis]OCT62552.1 hypothetical protein XELAEV_18043635mg [Xenopus laevis]
MDVGGVSRQSSVPCLMVEEPEEEVMKVAQEREQLVSKFLKEELSENFLRRQQGKVERLLRCSFYMEILSAQVEEEDDVHPRLPISVFQFIDSWKFQRMKKLAATQTRIQLLLLEKLLVQLRSGRASLVGMIQGHGFNSYLCKWEEVCQCISDIQQLQKDFLLLLVPRGLHLKHQLVSNISAPKIPPIRLVLRLRTPVVFDRLGSVVFRDWVLLRWQSLGQQCLIEKYELRFRLQEEEQWAVVSVSGNHLEIHHLLSDKLYEFTVRRAETYTLVYEAWHDTITLRTLPSHEQF